MQRQWSPTDPTYNSTKPNTWHGHLGWHAGAQLVSHCTPGGGAATNITSQHPHDTYMGAYHALAAINNTLQGTELQPAAASSAAGIIMCNAPLAWQHMSAFKCFKPCTSYPLSSSTSNLNAAGTACSAACPQALHAALLTPQRLGKLAQPAC